MNARNREEIVKAVMDKCWLFLDDLMREKEDKRNKKIKEMVARKILGIKGTKRLLLKQRFDIFKRDNFKCRYCGRGAEEVILEVDHINPVSCGGGNEQENLVTACKDCNLGKRDFLLYERQEEKLRLENKDRTNV